MHYLFPDSPKKLATLVDSPPELPPRDDHSKDQALNEYEKNLLTSLKNIAKQATKKKFQKATQIYPEFYARIDSDKVLKKLDNSTKKSLASNLSSKANIVNRDFGQGLFDYLAYFAQPHKVTSAQNTQAPQLPPRSSGTSTTTLSKIETVIVDNLKQFAWSAESKTSAQAMYVAQSLNKIKNKINKQKNINWENIKKELNKESDKYYVHYITQGLKKFKDTFSKTHKILYQQFPYNK